AYITRFYQPIRTLSQFYNQLQAATAAAEKVLELLDEPVTIRETAYPTTLWRVRGEVEFREVAFSYGREPVLEDVSFHADPGEMIALVGHTGAGKTTIASLLCRFYDPREGAILLDGHDLRDLSFRTLRESETELLVQQALHKLLAGRTSLVIAHRLSTIRAADQVLVLDAGRVVERGTHAELLRRRGDYFKLYEQQFAEAVPA